VEVATVVTESHWRIGSFGDRGGTSALRPASTVLPRASPGYFLG
jgi:hypothetical protein